MIFYCSLQYNTTVFFAVRNKFLENNQTLKNIQNRAYFFHFLTNYLYLTLSLLNIYLTQKKNQQQQKGEISIERFIRILGN